MDVFCPVLTSIFNILLLCLVAGLCHQLTNALVERKQVRMLFEYLQFRFTYAVLRALGSQPRAETLMLRYM